MAGWAEGRAGRQANGWMERQEESSMGIYDKDTWKQKKMGEENV